MEAGLLGEAGAAEEPASAEAAGAVRLRDLPPRGTFDPALNRSSLVQTTGVIFAEVLGAGVLGLPYAFSRLGWVLGTGSIILFCAMATYAGLLLSRLRNGLYAHAESYADLALATVGPRFGSFTRGCCLATWVLLLPYYMTTSAAALGAAFPHLHLCEYQRSLIVAAVLIVPLQLRDLHALSKACVVSTVASLCVVSIASTSLLLTRNADQTEISGRLLFAEAAAATTSTTTTTTTTTTSSTSATAGSSSSPHLYFGLSLWPHPDASTLELYGALAAVIFAFQGQSVFCEVMREMKSPSRFPIALSSANGTIALFYLILAFACCASRGDAIAPYMPDALTHGAAKLAANLLVVYVASVAYLVTGQPLHRATSSALAPATLAAGGPRARLVWFTATGAQLGCSYAIANAIPFFADFQALLGALTGAPILFGWPALFYLRGCAQHKLLVPRGERAVCLLFLAVCLPLFTCLGFVNAIQQILHDWSTQHGGVGC